jgi:sec-independent protein translocase protein TatA
MNVSPWELLIVLAIVILIFGVGKVADIGPALGKAISGFRKAVKDDEEDEVKKDEVNKVQIAEEKE